MREKMSSRVCERQRGRQVCASAQTDQHLCFSLFGGVSYRLANFNFLASLSTMVETPKTGFVALGPKYKRIKHNTRPPEKSA